MTTPYCPACQQYHEPRPCPVREPRIEVRALSAGARAFAERLRRAACIAARKGVS